MIVNDGNTTDGTTADSTALVPVNKETEMTESKDKKNKDKKAPKDKAETKASGVERKIHYGTVDVFKLPTAANGAPEWLIKLHGDRVTTQLKEGLIESVAEHGIRKPIEAFDDRGVLHILDGVQRFRALIDANKMRKSEGKPLHPVPYTVAEKGLSSSQLFALGMQLNGFVKIDDKLATAAKAAALYKLAREDGLNDTDSQRLVASALGDISPAMVHNYLVMHTASPTIKKLCADGKVAASVVMELAHLPQEEQEKALKEAAALSGVKDKKGDPVATVSAVKGVVKARQGKYNTKDPVDAAAVKRIIKEHIEGDLNEIDPATIKVMRFCMGQIGAEDVHVKGFTGAVRYITGK